MCPSRTGRAGRRGGAVPVPLSTNALTRRTHRTRLRTTHPCGAPASVEDAIDPCTPPPYGEGRRGHPP